jgi:hypothetical protein
LSKNEASAGRIGCRCARPARRVPLVVLHLDVDRTETHAPKTVYRGGCVDECAEYLERSPSANLGRLVPRSEGRAIALTLFVGLDVR